MQIILQGVQLSGVSPTVFMAGFLNNDTLSSMYVYIKFSVKFRCCHATDRGSFQEITNECYYLVNFWYWISIIIDTNKYLGNGWNGHRKRNTYGVQGASCTQAGE